jgi:deoxyribodipyrimidine photolyase
VIDQLKVSKDVSVVHDFKGGETEAINLLQAFLDTKLANYGVDRNDPSKDATSVVFLQLIVEYVPLPTFRHDFTGVHL